MKRMSNSFVMLSMPQMGGLVVNVRSALDPHSTFIKVWHQVLCAVLAYDLFFIPFTVTFRPHEKVAETPEGVMFYVTELLFLIDFWVKFNTGFYEDGSVHRDLYKSRMKYVRSKGFVLDVIAIIPWSLLPTELGASQMWLEVPKLLRLWRLPMFSSNLDDVYARHFEALKIFKVVITMLLFSHYVACIRFSFGYDYDHNNQWLPKFPNTPHTPRRQYLMSLFWGFGMLTGFFEGELPHSFSQFVFTLSIGLGGFSVFTYLCAMFFMLSKCENGHIEASEAHINQLKHIMAFHQVPKWLQAQAIEYMEQYSTNAESNDREVMRMLCPSLAKDIQVELMQDTMARIPVFIGCNKNFIKALTDALEMLALPAHCTLFSAGDEGDAMYIIQTGVLDVIIGSTKVSIGYPAFNDQYSRQLADVKENVWWARVLLQESIRADSKVRLWWLVILQVNLIYNWVFIPLQLAYPVMDIDTWYINVPNTIADIVLVADIYLNFNLSYVKNAETITSPTRCARRYFREKFLWDFFVVFPYSALGASWIRYPKLRIPRLLRVVYLKKHLQEVDKMIHLNNRRKLLLFGGLLLVLGHVVACFYFSITLFEGFNPGYDSWIPTEDVMLVKIQQGLFADVNNLTFTTGSSMLHWIAARQYSRSLYYATNILTGLGKTVEPSNDRQYGAALVFMFSGFIVTAIVVDNVQKRFTASAYEQKEFFAVRTRIQLFLRRQDAPFAIHHRVNSFLDYWWSAHRGARVNDLLMELPLGYRREVLRAICAPALQTLALLGGVRPVWKELEMAFVDRVQFVLYGQGEFIYRAGENAHSVYFLLRGAVKLRLQGTPNKNIPEGGFFGTCALNAEEDNNRYTTDAVASSGCVLVQLLRDDGEALGDVFSHFDIALRQLEQRLFENKLARFASDNISHGADTSPPSRWHILLHSAWDPDSIGAMVWQSWLFIAMTVQWVLVIYHIAFGIGRDHFVALDSVTVVLELSFVLDMYVQSRSGYHEFGNKVMDLKRIRYRYFHSRTFIIDLIALVPFFMLNWAIPATRYEAFNVNKLVRLLKVPGQFRQLEQRFLKRTTELRLFKLVYYAFLLTHVAGCMYFDFSSHLSLMNLYDPNIASRDIDFGTTKWVLPASFKDADVSYQYFSALFVMYGLMSAAYQGELPKTAMQSIFSVVTMISGFFLFAYVIGNFADIIEMMDSGNREFNDRFGSVRQLMVYFSLPDTISSKLRTFFYFRRFHTITQEHLIESYLSPSLVTDIRLFNLQPMISKVPFLSGMEASITRVLVAEFNQVLVLKDEYVYKFGDESSDMYFVFTGILAVLSPARHKKSEIARRKSRLAAGRSMGNWYDTGVEAGMLAQLGELVSGDFFGENALFSNSPRNAFVLAKTSCILYQLSRQSLERIFDRYPLWKKQVLQTMKVQQKQRRLHSRMDRQREDESSVSGRGELVEDEENSEDISPAGMVFRPPLPISRKGLLKNAPRSLDWLTHGTPAQGHAHLRWLRLVMGCTVFIAFIIPYRLAVDNLDRQTVVCMVLRAVEVVCDVIFLLDIWVNWHLQEGTLSVEFYEQDLRQSYKRERLVWDAIASIPIDYLVFAVSGSAWFRLMSCVKMMNLVYYLNEVNRQSVSYEWTRLRAIWLLYIIAMVWTGCVYLVIATRSGHGTNWDAWSPSTAVEVANEDNPSNEQLILRFLRGFFFATTAFVKKCRTFFPETTDQAAFTILASFMGVLITAFTIGEIASLYISLIRNQVTFRKNQISVELYLARYKIAPTLRDRVRFFLSATWSAHSGVNYDHVLAELPSKMRTEVVLHIAEAPLKAFLEAIFRPLMRTDGNSMGSLLQLLVQELKFEAYPRGEYVIVEGVLSSSMYFVVRGQLVSSSEKAAVPFRSTRYRRGQYFGEKGLLVLSVSQVSVRAVKACDLFALSSAALLRVLQSHGFVKLALAVAEETLGCLRATTPSGVLPYDMDTWKEVLESVLQRQRREWLSRSTSSLTTELTGGNSGNSTTQWGALLVDVQDSDKEDHGLARFTALLELLTPHGVSYDHPRSTVMQALSSDSPRASGKIRLREMVLKMSKPISGR
ncbi:hypothetical protein Poli38472_014191 [Pythium oligandrum]|uniref:Cyclic nucleotide-binding domain-containing protein n=1 Tax=Pythium oligandrum TaxID=41045 RepID=A0A8K1CI99_PYTOL|nr:hypothetical protein Poli38472_014191 [Pythium oligandrum]|eukprot:TMW64074.1 hypothetical protein Poli38472_014191 [Pythium oligandrum]